MNFRDIHDKRRGFLIYAFFGLSAIIFISVLTQFYRDLSGYSSLYTSGGVTAPLQLFYNYQNGRPFQTSLFATVAAGDSVGFSYNPYPYLHIFAIHVYITPFIFSYIWNVFPNVYWLYGLVILVNYFSIFIFIYLILKKYSYRSMRIKFIFLSAAIFSSGALYTFLSHAQLLMFSAPFLFMAIYFAINNKIYLYLFSIILLCGISEDAILFASMLSLYFSTDKSEHKKYYLLIGVVAALYFLICIFIIQPMARVDLTNISHNTTLVVLEKIFYLKNINIAEKILSIAPILSLIPIFFISNYIFGRSELTAGRVLLFLFIPSFFHLGESLVVGAGHHLAPVVYIFIATLTLYVAKTKKRNECESVGKIEWLAIAFLILVSTAISLRVYASFVPKSALVPVLNAFGRGELVSQLVNDNQGELNRSIVDKINSISAEDSISYYANMGVDGFVAARKKIWRFPDYYDRTKYLVIQRSASNASFSISRDENLDINQAILKGYSVDSTGGYDITNQDIWRVVNSLVYIKKTHLILDDCDEYIVLMNRAPDILDNHPSTHGYGWFKQK